MVDMEMVDIDQFKKRTNFGRYLYKKYVEPMFEIKIYNSHD